MLPDTPLSRRWTGILRRRIPEGASPEEIADGIVVIWVEINMALHPIIGFRGVAALFNRSLLTTAREFPWLSEGHANILAEVNASALKATLLRQPAESAMVGGSALFVAFHELLASLVGSALTHQLLLAAWSEPKGSDAAQDLSQ